MEMKIKYGGEVVDLKGDNIETLAQDLDSKLKCEEAVTGDVEIVIDGNCHKATFTEPIDIVEALNSMFKDIDFE